MTTLTNSFHNTETRVRATPEELEAIREKAETGFGWERKEARAKALRIRRKLCGFEGCTCGDFFGARG